MRILRPSEFSQFTGNFGPMTPEEIAEALALAKADFTADDLQQYTEELDGTPMEDFLNELEEAQRRADQGKP